MNSLDNLTPIISAHAADLKKPGVISIRPGYRLENGWPSTDPAIVVIVSRNAVDLSFPDRIEGIPVDVRRADEVEELRFQDPLKYSKIAEHRAEFRGDAFPEIDPVKDDAATERAVDFAAAKPQIPYTGPDGASLTPVTGKFAVTCHASPDAGWPTLRQFLAGTQSSLTVGMYDFTSKHILDELNSDLLGKQQLEIVLDNPDWHVIIEEPQLAKMYEAFLKHDFEVASAQAGGAGGVMAAELEVDVPQLEAAARGDFLFHRPLRIENEAMTITPLLTPDAGIYQPAIL